MKRILALCTAVLLMLLPLAYAEAEIDLSGMSYDELVALKDQINKAMWESEEWQEVTVPQGVYEIGEDIPAGHWTIAAADGQYVSVSWGTKLNDTKTDVEMVWEDGFYEMESMVSAKSDYYDDGDRTEVDFDLQNGQYLVVSGGNVVFTPYQGKPSLGFK